MDVNFYDMPDINDSSLMFAVIAAEYEGKWVFCRHKDRATYEIPGGHREAGESIEETGKRELYEETGAIQFDIRPLCVYSVSGNEEITYGMLYYANIIRLEPLPQDTEIAEIIFCDTIPDNLTYPQIQPHLSARALTMINDRQ